VREFAMSRIKDVRWGKWVGMIAGVLVVFKSLVFVIARLLRLANNEVQARGSDTAYVLRLVDRRMTGHG
jgi:hypothetical protein